MESQRVNRPHRRRNLPAELKVEIVDCLPTDHAVHFLANVPNRLIIHHCAPRVRAMLKKIYQIAADYARTLSAPSYNHEIHIKNEGQYTQEMSIFFRYGAAYCKHFTIYRADYVNDSDFAVYPANFFNDLIKHYYETKVSAKAIPSVVIELPLTNPAPWPAAFVQPQAGEMKLKESDVDGEWKIYNLRNKYNPDIELTFWIIFEGDAECYQQMTYFLMFMALAQSGSA